MATSKTTTKQAAGARPQKEPPPRPHLGAYRTAVLDLVRGNTQDLSMRQQSVLLECGERHTVRELADHLRVGKPVVTRASQSLQARGYVTKDRDLTNLRSVIIERTREGEAYVRRIETILTRALPLAP